MDFMFEDEVDEVGSDVEAYCPKCKGDTTHVVISKYEDEIRRVQCNPCGDVHSFRKPRGDAEDDVPEPIAAKKRAMMKKADLGRVLRQARGKRRKALRIPRALPRKRHRDPPQVRARVRLGGGVRQQGRDHLQGCAAGAGAQPQGHARAAAGGRGGRHARRTPRSLPPPRPRRPRKAAAGRQGGCRRRPKRRQGHNDGRQGTQQSSRPEGTAAKLNPPRQHKRKGATTPAKAAAAKPMVQGERLAGGGRRRAAQARSAKAHREGGAPRPPRAEAARAKPARAESDMPRPSAPARSPPSRRPAK